MRESILHEKTLQFAANIGETQKIKIKLQFAANIGETQKIKIKSFNVKYLNYHRI